MKNKIVTKVILAVVCVATLVVTFVVPCFASLDVPNASNPSTSQYSFPSGSLQVSLADPERVLTGSDGYDANIPFFNYAGAGSEIVATFNNDSSTTLQGSLNKTFERSMLYTDVKVLANTGFDGLYNSFTTRYNLIGGYGSAVRLKGFTFDDIVLLNSGYSFVQVYGELSDYLMEDQDFDIGVRYDITYYDRLIKNYKHVDVAMPLTYNVGSDYFVFEFLPEELGIDGDIVYCSHYSVTFSANSVYDEGGDSLDIIEPRFETRLAVPRLNVYNNYQSQINQDFYNAGVNSIEDGSFNFFDSIISTVNTFMSWEFIPNISMGIILSVVLGVSLMIMFLKFFAGG